MKLHFGEAWSILMKTLPCVIVRMVVYGIVGICAALYLGILLLMTKVFGGAGGILFLIGLAILFGILKLVQRYVLYLIKAGHIAVITAFIQNGELPENTGQIEYGKRVVTDLFKEVSVLFAVDKLVSGTIKAFNRMVFFSVFCGICLHCTASQDHRRKIKTSACHKHPWCNLVTVSNTYPSVK